MNAESKSYKEVSDYIIKLKKESPTRCMTNIYAGILQEDSMVNVLHNEGSVVFWLPERYRVRMFFCTSDLESMRELSKQIPSGTVSEFLIREVDDEYLIDMIFNDMGFDKHSMYVRVTQVWGDRSPYTVHEIGRRKLLEQMYEENFGEYPTEDDVDELFEINKSTFDSQSDDIFTKQEWLDIIKEKRILVHRENGEIVTFYIWRQRGRKLEINVALNRGGANYLYNIERRVFEEFWEKGIRIFYFWKNRDNSAAWRHANPNPEIKELLISKTYLYNSIYVKR